MKHSNASRARNLNRRLRDLRMSTISGRTKGTSKGKVKVGTTNVNKPNLVKVAKTTTAEGGTKDKESDTFVDASSVKAVISRVVAWCYNWIRKYSLPVVAGWSQRLSQWLTRMALGYKKDNRTFFFKGLSYQQLDAKFTKIVAESLARVAEQYSDIPDFAQLYEEVQANQIKKFGTKSRFAPWSVWGPEKVEAVWEAKPKTALFHKYEKAYLRALDWLESLVPAGSLKWHHPSTTWPTDSGDDTLDVRSTINTETNSCFPSFVKNWFHANWGKSQPSENQKTVQQHLTELVDDVVRFGGRCRSYKDLLKHPAFQYVAVANQRTVQQGHSRDDPKYEGLTLAKTRLVIAMPKIDTLLGKPLLNELIEASKKIMLNGMRIFTALTSPERVDKNMEVCLQLAHKHKLIVLSTDFSAFDAHLAPWFMWDVAERIAQWFEPKARKYFLALVYAEINNVTLVTPDRVYAAQPSSMKSGEIFTNILDSYCNLTAQRLGLEAGIYKSILAQFVQGDDGVLLGAGVNPKSFEFVSSILGLEANASKQMYKPNALSFLQKIHVRGYPGGIYPFTRAANSCFSLEDDVKLELDKDEHEAFPWAVTYRTLARLNTACFDVNFETGAELFAREDRLKLGRDLDPEYVAKMAGSYAEKWAEEWALKPYRQRGEHVKGFGDMAINRVLRGEQIPPPGRARFKFVYNVEYEAVAT